MRAQRGARVIANVAAPEREQAVRANVAAAPAPILADNIGDLIGR